MTIRVISLPHVWRGCVACYGYVTAVRAPDGVGGQYVLRSFHIHIIVDLICFLV